MHFSAGRFVLKLFDHMICNLINSPLNLGYKFNVIYTVRFIYERKQSLSVHACMRSKFSYVNLVSENFYTINRFYYKRDIFTRVVYVSVQIFFFGS